MKHTQTYLLIVVIFAVVLALALGNPYSEEWPLKCPLYFVTRLKCPLCGMQRAAHELLRGNLVEAWRMNQGLILASPYLVCLCLGQLHKPLQQRAIIAFCYRNKVILTFLALAAVWGIVRNLI